MKKKFGYFYFDNFLLEKEFNEGLDQKTLYHYSKSFEYLITSNSIKYDDFSTYTDFNFKKHLAFLFENRKRGPVTYNTYRKIYNSYCNYLKNEKLILINPFENIKKMKEEKKLFKFYNKEEVGLIQYYSLNIFDLDTYIGLRDYTVLQTLLFTGLRRSEIINLKICDVHLNENFIHVVNGKGGKDRFVPIIPNLSKILFKYYNFLIINMDSDNILFFPSKNGNKLTEKNLYGFINKLKDKLPFNITIHKFRHTFATELVRNNFDIFNIAQILGHSKIETTKIYLNADTEKLKLQLSNVNFYT